MVSCGVLWGLTVIVASLAFGCLFFALLRQQKQLQQLSSLNEELSGTINRINVDQHQLNDTFREFATIKTIIKQLGAPETLPSKYIGAIASNSLEVDIQGKIKAHNQVFTSSKVHDDTYSVDLVPPFNNAWVIVDASLGDAGIVCSGKADVILRS